MLGIINLNKPAGKTSHDMVSFCRRLLQTRRVGHAGTLDPCAEGVLPILVGKATALSDLLTEKTKTYVARVRLGIETDTYDTTGTITAQGKSSFSPKEIEQAAQAFIGKINQQPPMYSAIKIEGQKLYELARKGITVERPSRSVQIYSLRCFDFSGEEFSMEVCCSKGTYIRSLCHDLGKHLGSHAAMAALTRTQSGSFLIENAFTPEQLTGAMQNGETERFLLPPEVVLNGYPKVCVSKENAIKIRNGIRLRPEQLGLSGVQEGDCLRAYDENSLLCLLRATRAPQGLVLAIGQTFYE